MTIKLDALLAFNPAHPLCAPVLAAGVRVNVFSDTIIRDSIVILGSGVPNRCVGYEDAKPHAGAPRGCGGGGEV